MSKFHAPLPLLLMLLWATQALAGEPGYLRYPDLHGDTVFFAAEGDLWSAPLAGGEARRLTTHPGTEAYPHISPDGQWIAFTGKYDGNNDVFVIPVDGGEPRRLTWHPSTDEVVGWLPDGSGILFRSRGHHPHGSYELFTVNPQGGEAQEVPLGWAANLAVDPDSGSWAFNRLSREHRTWKRYRGGWAQEIWVGHPDKHDFAKVTDFDGTDAFPMWHGGKIYFLSDHGGTANLWSMNPDGSDRQRLTDHGDWDARWPGMGPDGRIAYMLAGDIHLFDPADGSSHKVDIGLPSDSTLTRERYPNPGQTMTWFNISPDGDRVIVVTRGEAFSIPVEDGVTLPLSGGSSARESWASYGPDGKRIVYVTDASGEEAIATADAWGRGDVKTAKAAGADGWHFPPRWSPDGTWIAYSDQTYTLYLVPAEGGEPTVVDRSEQWEITDYTWSADGRWLAYSKADRRDYSTVYVYDTQTGEATSVTGPATDDHSPAWDPKGRYLYFLSNRHINPLLGERDFEYVLTRSGRPHLVLLRPDVDNPFLDDEGLPPADAAEADEKRDKRKKRKCKKLFPCSRCLEDDNKDDDKPPAVTLELDGIEGRTLALDVAAGRYGSLAATEDKLLFMSYPVRGMNEPRDPKATSGPTSDLMFFDMEDEEAGVFAPRVSGFELSMDSKNLALMRKWGELYVVDSGSPPGDGLADGAVSFGGLVVELDPREEWRQIYYEGWRHMRDFTWEPGLGGLDWEAVRDQYATLLPRLATRDDLRDLMGEVIGELSTSHTYVWGGDYGYGGDSVDVGLLGADLTREGQAWRVERIYRGDPADNVRSPLAEPGVDVLEGEYILAVNHQPLPAGQPFEAAMTRRVGKAVVFTVADKPEGGTKRDVVVVPVGSDRQLRYCDWVRRKREYVDEQSGGKLGYVHIPNMGTAGLIAFETWFYPQLGKQGLVIDVRWNGGGFVSQLILERLRRKLIAYDRARGGGVWSYPSSVLNGPFVVVTNQHAGSDGDIFPAAVQAEGLAPVIGERSWGGVVGIRGDKRLVDGGLLTQPEFAFWFLGKGWGIENHGVDPDIVVVNPPQDVARDMDAQLDRAILECLKLREEGEWMLPEFGDAPLKTRDAYRELEQE